MNLDLALPVFCSSILTIGDQGFETVLQLSKSNV